MAKSFRTPGIATFLMVDDDEEDIYLAKRAFKEHVDQVRLCSVQSGVELFEWLRHESTPKLILLDVKMPVQNGFDIIEIIKASDEHSHIPVVMFSTSDAESDIRRAYSLGASSYICKPASADEMRRTAQKLCEYWLVVNRTPNHAA